MSAGSKSCPTCLKQWAGTFKFCPEDGTLLVALGGAGTMVTPAAAKAPTETGKRKTSKTVEVSKPRTSRSQRVVTEAAARPVPAPMPEPAAKPTPTDKQGPRAGRKGSPRLLNLEPVGPATIEIDAAVEAELQVDLAPKPGPGNARQIGLRTAPTVLTPAAAESIVAESRARAAQPFEDPMPEPVLRSPAERAARQPARKVVDSEPLVIVASLPPEPADEPARIVGSRGVKRVDSEVSRRAPAESSRSPRPERAPASEEAPRPAKAAGNPPGSAGKRKRDEFSETAWFMRPEQTVDPSTGRVLASPDAYKADENIPEEKRRRFSLRKKGEE